MISEAVDYNELQLTRETSYWRVVRDERTGRKVWQGRYVADEFESDFVTQGTLTLTAEYYPVGTRLSLSEPENSELSGEILS